MSTSPEPTRGPVHHSPGAADSPPPTRLRRRWIILIAVGAVLAAAAAGGLSWFRISSERQFSQVERIPDPFVSIPPSERPPKPKDGRTFLLAGVDALPDDTSDPGRSDALMVVRTAADRKWSYVISIPRDAWVEVPGHGMAKINAAYAWGGPTLAVRTVERLTGLHIDHFAVVGMSGFRELTDAVGGVSVTIPDRPGAGADLLPPGRHQLTGEQALAYVRERKSLPQGDLDRVQRQQNYLRELMVKVLDRNMLTDPLRVNTLLEAVAKTVRVDDALTNDMMREMMMELSDMQVLFVTVPVNGTGRVGDQSVVWLHEEEGPGFWSAVRTDRLRAYLAKKEADQLGDVVP